MTPDDKDLDEIQAELLHRAMGALGPRRVNLSPSVRASIMRRIREAPAPAWRRAWDWLWLPRPMVLRPVALALSVVVLVAASLLVGSRVTRAPSATARVTPPRSVVRFVLVEPRASAVTVTGSFVSWDPAGVPLRRLPDGLWMGELKLDPGIYQYVFLLDGREWRPDPNAAWSVDDGLGRRNSVLVVPGAGTS